MASLYLGNLEGNMAVDDDKLEEIPWEKIQSMWFNLSEIMASLLRHFGGTPQRSPPQGSAVGPTYPTPQTHGVETTRAEALTA